MDNSNRTSFIPKSPVRGVVKPRGTRKVFIFSYISFVLFFGTLLVSAGTFFYNHYLDSQLSEQKNNLSEERIAFNQANLERILDLDVRMSVAFDILDRQVSVYRLLTALEDTTLSSVQIQSFEYKQAVDNELSLSMSVRAHDFNVALFQREIFSGNNILQGIVISDIQFTNSVDSGSGAVSSGNEVTFMITKDLSPKTIHHPVLVKEPVTEKAIETEEVTETEVLTEEYIETVEDSAPVIKTDEMLEKEIEVLGPDPVDIIGQ